MRVRAAATLFAQLGRVAHMCAHMPKKHTKNTQPDAKHDERPRKRDCDPPSRTPLLANSGMPPSSTGHNNKTKQKNRNK